MFHCTFHLAPLTLCLSRLSAAVMKSGGSSKVTAGSATQNPGIVYQGKRGGWLLCLWEFQQVSAGIRAEGTNGWRMDDGCSGTSCVVSVMNLFRLISHTEPAWSFLSPVCVRASMHGVGEGLEGGEGLTLSNKRDRARSVNEDLFSNSACVPTNTTDPKVQYVGLFCFTSYARIPLTRLSLTQSRRVRAPSARGVELTLKKGDSCIITILVCAIFFL